MTNRTFTRDLRDRLAKAIRQGAPYSDLRPSYRVADAVLPVVEDETAALHARAERAEAAVQRIDAFAASLQEPGAPLFWPEMGRRIQQELNDHGAGSGRCPSCDHPVSLHQPDGCWFAVTEGTVGRDLVCPCSVPRTALDQLEEAPDAR